MGKTQTTGQAAEDFACRYLIQQGLRLITRNFTCRTGEIDLIMQDKTHLVFIEVRFRNTNLFGGSLASVTSHKQKKLLKTALFYLQHNNLIDKVAGRFDVIAIKGLPLESKNLEWIKNAFA